MPYDRDGVTAQLKEINDFASVLGAAIPAHNNDVIALAVHTIGGELRELVEQFPGVRDTTVAGGVAERLAAREALKDLVLIMRLIGVDAAAGRYDEAAVEYQSYRKLTFAEVPIILKKPQPWSLFNPDVHQGAFRRVAQVASVSAEAPPSVTYRHREREIIWLALLRHCISLNSPQGRSGRLLADFIRECEHCGRDAEATALAVAAETERSVSSWSSCNPRRIVADARCRLPPRRPLPCRREFRRRAGKALD